MITTIRNVRWRLQRRKRFAAEHLSGRWTRFTCRERSAGPKSPSGGYAAALNQGMLWPKEVLRTGLFPLLMENMRAMTPKELRAGSVME